MLVRSKTMAKALRTGTRDAVRALTIDLKMAKNGAKIRRFAVRTCTLDLKMQTENSGYEGVVEHQVTG